MAPSGSGVGPVMESPSYPSLSKQAWQYEVRGKDTILTKIFHLSLNLSGQFAQIHPEKCSRETRAFFHGLWWRSASPAEASG